MHLKFSSDILSLPNRVGRSVSRTRDSITDIVLRNIEQTINERKMISPGDLVICGVSGGPDSMCLLHALFTLQDDLGFRLHVGYLHHHMREQADSDAKMVVSFAEKHGIPATVGHADVFALAKDMGIGSEEAGREARYRFYFELLESLDAQKVALGHNLNDQAETVLMRLARGAGTKGLAGIPPVRGPIIRPIIGVKREMIEEYCRENKIPTITDSFNLDLRYTRNLVRYKVLPFMTDILNPSLIDTLSSTATVLSWDAEFLDKKADEAFLRHSQKEGVVTSVEEAYLTTEHMAMSSRVVERAWKEATLRTDNLHIDNVLDVLEENRAVSLPGKVTAVREDGWVRFYPDVTKVTRELKIPGDTRIPEMGVTISTSLKRREEAADFSKGVYTRKIEKSRRGLISFLVEPLVMLDYNKCDGPMKVRGRQDGDRFQPLGLNGQEQKLKDFFISRKVPRRYRDLVPIIMSGDQIIWVGGMRLSERVKIDDSTTTVLELQIKPDSRYRVNCDTIH
jgi:tRNA(Ile)-lysidine synthase